VLVTPQKVVETFVQGPGRAFWSPTLLLPLFGVEPVELRGIPIRTVARKSSIGAFTFVQGAWHSKAWQNIHWFILSHISIRGGLEHCLGE